MKTTVGWAIKNEKGEYLQCSGAHPVTPFQLRWVKRQWALFPVRPSPAWGGHGRIVKIVRTK